MTITKAISIVADGAGRINTTLPVSPSPAAIVIPWAPARRLASGLTIDMRDSTTQRGHPPLSGKALHANSVIRKALLDQICAYFGTSELCYGYGLLDGAGGSSSARQATP